MIKKISFTGIFKEEEARYTALCPEFDVASFGNTIGEAKKNLTEAVETYLEGAKELGILNEVLDDAGFKVQPDEEVILINEYISGPMVAELVGA